MQTIEEIAERIRDSGVRYEVIAAETGLSFNTVRLIATGKHRSSPKSLSLRLLEAWLDKQEGAMGR